MEGRLGLAAALFRVDTSNSFDVDPVTGGLILGALDTGERRRVDGFEFTLTGKITTDRSILAGYTHLQGTVLSGANAGRVAPYVPENADSMWTTYDISAFGREMWSLPGRITIGGGVSIDDGDFPASDNVTRLPGTISLDALVSYETDDYRFAVNAYNLADEPHYGGAFSTRAIPTSGRAVLVSLGAQFPACWSMCAAC